MACGLAAGVFSMAAGGEGGAAQEVALTYGMRAFQHGEYKDALDRFEEAVRLDPDDGTARFWLGLARLKTGDAKGAAADIGASLQLKRPASVERGRVLSSLGEAQLEAGDAAAAERTLKEAMAANPNDAATLYFHGLALARLGRTEEGRGEAERARQIDPTLPQVPERTVAPGTRGESVETTAALPFFEIRLGAEVGHDSNPAAISDDVTPFDPSTGAVVERADDVGNLDLRAEIHPFYDRAGWSLGLRLHGYQTLHQDLDSLDLTQARGAFSLAWGKDPLGVVTGPMGYTRVPSGDSRVSFLIQGGTAYSELDGDSYVRSHQAAGSATIRESKSTATQVDLHWQDFNFFQSTGNPILTGDLLNGHETSLGASQYFYLGRRDRYVRVGGVAGDVRRANAFFSGSFREGTIELSLPLHRRLMLYLSGSRRKDDLDEGQTPHKEETTVAVAALVWAFADHFYLTARGATVRFDEGEPLFDFLDYDRTLATVGVTWHH